MAEELYTRPHAWKQPNRLIQSTEEGRTGEEGLRACRFDLVLSYTVIGVFGLAVVIIGSRTSVHGQGNELALLLADQLATHLGQSGKWIFLVGFWAAVFSALLGVWQSLPYLFTDFLLLRKGSGVASLPQGTAERSRSYRCFCCVGRCRSYSSRSD